MSTQIFATFVCSSQSERFWGQFYLIEITLIEELLENIDEFWKRWVSFFKVFDELCGTQTISHVETDVHLDTSHVISQFDDRNL